MSGQRPDGPPPPEAIVNSSVSRARRLSLIWVIPIVTALIGGWIAWDNFHKRGASISIVFQTAEGLQAGQSHVRYKDVDMGLVTRIGLTPDRQHVAVMVEMQREATPFLVEGTQFWVVKPRFFAGSISGLETLVSGAYIAMSPPKDLSGTEKWEFAGLEDPPVLQSDVPGRTFLLQAERIGSLSLGSPIYYRDLNVGEILGWDIGDMARNVTLHAFVREPFDKYVRDSSRFWNASGVSVKLGAEGVQIQVESLKTILLGGVAFDTPAAGTGTSQPSAENHSFKLFASHDLADAASEAFRVPLISYFNSSVRGLVVGAPVEVRGIKIGQVTDVRLQYDPATDSILVPVRYEIEPQRIADTPVAPQIAQVRSRLEQMVAHGLRAQLGSGSLVTGQKLITLDVVPHAAPAELAMEGDMIVLPTAPGGGFDSLADAASEVLAKVDAIPFEQIGANLNDTLKGMSQIANGADLRNTLASLRGTLATAQETVRQVNAGLQPALKQLPAIAAGLQDTVARANKLVASVDQTYAGNSAFNRNLDQLMAQLADTATSVRILADLLTRHPEALIRGRTDTGVQ